MPRRRSRHAPDMGPARPAPDLFTLWGWHPDHCDEPIRIRTGYLRECNPEQRRRNKAGWLTDIYGAMDEPTGLRLQVAERRAKGGTDGR